MNGIKEKFEELNEIKKSLHNKFVYILKINIVAIGLIRDVQSVVPNSTRFIENIISEKYPQNSDVEKKPNIRLSHRQFIR